MGLAAAMLKENFSRHDSRDFGKRTYMITLSKNGTDFSFPARAEKLDRLSQAKKTPLCHRSAAEKRNRAFIRLFAQDLSYRRMRSSRETVGHLK